jgi:oxysterol-binding protein-related protein 9/10/11
VAQIEYKGKGYFSGKTHSFKALVTPPGSSTAKHTIEGQWHTTSKDAHGTLFHDVQGPKEEVSTESIEEQGEWESRRLWRLVSQGIRESDFETASREKSKIEVSVISPVNLDIIRNIV